VLLFLPANLLCCKPFSFVHWRECLQGNSSHAFENLESPQWYHCMVVTENQVFLRRSCCWSFCACTWKNFQHHCNCEEGVVERRHNQHPIGVPRSSLQTHQRLRNFQTRWPSFFHLTEAARDWHGKGWGFPSGNLEGRKRKKMGKKGREKGENWSWNCPELR